MAITYEKLFEPFLLTATDSTLMTNNKAAGTVLRGGRVSFTNVTAAARTFTIYAVPAAGTSAPTNSFAFSRSLGANQSLELDIPLLKVGDSLVAKADVAASVNVQAVNGAYFTP